MSKDYTQMVYEIIKPLALLEPPVKIYRNVIDEDYDSRPDDFVVFSSGISNVPHIYGDGKVLTRRCNCDITVNERGTGNNEHAGYLVSMVEKLLQENNIHYTRSDVGYVENMDSMQTNFDFYLI